MLVGNSGVGKTSIIRRFVYDEFSSEPSETGNNCNHLFKKNKN
jgi:GTPase SAR1 family protein